VAHDKTTVRKVLNQAHAQRRAALTAPEARALCEAYGITVPKEGVATSAADAATLATSIGYPVVKPVVASLAGDLEVEEASEYLYQHGIPAYPYSTEIPVAVLGATLGARRRAHTGGLTSRRQRAEKLRFSTQN